MACCGSRARRQPKKQNLKEIAKEELFLTPSWLLCLLFLILPLRGRLLLNRLLTRLTESMSREAVFSTYYDED